MPADCSGFVDLIAGVTSKMETAQAALQDAQSDLNVAEASLAAAGAAAAACAAAAIWGPPGWVAFAACEAAALAAAAAAGYAVSVYSEKVEQAQSSINALQGWLDLLNKQYEHCQELQSWQVQAAQQLLAEAQGYAAAAEDVEIPDVDSAAADEAEDAVAEAEDAADEMEEYARDHPRDDDFANA